MLTLAELSGRHSGPGRLDWIGLRPERGATLDCPDAVDVTRSGLSGDRARKGKRAVTLIQAEHLPVIASLVRAAVVGPETVRRNLVVSGLNLSTMRGGVLQIGSARLLITQPCVPCSKMETALGHGGYNAMRGHGGWCAEVIGEGRIAIGDAVTAVEMGIPAES